MNLSYKKVILLLLYSPTDSSEFNVPISGRTRLMKMGFLFREELLDQLGLSSSKTDLPEYFAWKYGPFSKDLLDDLEFLVNQDYVVVSDGEGIPLPEELEEFRFWIEDASVFNSREYQEESFSLTDHLGITKAAEFWDLLEKPQQSIVVNFKKILTGAPLDRILEYVYRKYAKEGLTDKSLIREKYLA